MKKNKTIIGPKGGTIRFPTNPYARNPFISDEMYKELKSRRKTNSKSFDLFLRIESTYFIAGVEISDDKVVNSAPILKYMNGWKLKKVLEYSKKKNWKIELVDSS